MAGEFTVELGGKTFKTQAESLQQVWGAVGPDAGAIGALITDPDGNTTYASNTQQWRRNDPAFFELFRRGDLTEKAMTDASQLAAPLEETSLALRQERILAANPIASRYASSVQGIPFVGEYGDEIVGSVMGDDTQDQIRAAQAAVADRRPGQAFAGQLGMGVAATLPLAALGTLGRGASLLRTALTGGVVGASGGAIEGGVSGYGSGETPDERFTNALQRAILGGSVGAPLGALAPVAGAGISRLWAMRPGQQVSKAAQEAAASPEAMRGAAQLGGMQPPLAAPTIPTSLAEASTPYRQGLDASMAVPSAAIDPTMSLLNRYATEASGRLKGTLDDLLGSPEGVATRQRDLMEQTAEQRAAFYDDAYEQIIDYSGEAGDRLRKALDSVDDDVIRAANANMRRDELSSEQVAVLFNRDGDFIGFEDLPDVRQIDYITRAISNKIEAARAANKPEDVATLTRQLQRIRGQVDTLVPEYKAARGLAGDVIREREALNTGYEVLSTAMKRDEVGMALEGMTPAELNNVRLGLRQHIDDIMSRASSPLDPNGDEYKEALRALTSLSRRDNQDKMRMVMGDEAADALFAQLKETVPSMLTRMQGVAAGSQTAPRALAQGVIDEGAGVAPTGDLISDLRAGAQSILRYGAKTPNEARQEVAAELAPLLAQQRTPQDFVRMQELLAQTSRAMRRERDLASGGVRFGGVTGLAATPAATRGAEELSGLSPVRGKRR